MTRRPEQSPMRSETGVAGYDPWTLALRWSEAAFQAFSMRSARPEAEPLGPPSWTTPHNIRLEMPGLIVRDFAPTLLGLTAARPVVVVAPLALHGAVIADLAPGHSLVERLLAEGCAPLHLVEWTPATAETARFDVDDYLLRLAAAIEDVGPPVALLGLCQGGWLALMLAARFPRLVARLALVAAPVDVEAAPSTLATLARMSSHDALAALLEAGGGVARGRTLHAAWPADGGGIEAARAALEVETPSDDMLARFRTWDAWTLDLPGPYYRRVVEEVFADNALGRGRFVALGRRLDLRALRMPILALAGSRDEVVPAPQLMAVLDRVGTRPNSRSAIMANTGHLGLMMGLATLSTVWPRIALWLGADEARRGRLTPRSARRRAR